MCSFSQKTFILVSCYAQSAQASCVPTLLFLTMWTYSRIKQSEYCSYFEKKWTINKVTPNFKTTMKRFVYVDYYISFDCMYYKNRYPRLLTCLYTHQTIFFCILEIFFIKNSSYTVLPRNKLTKTAGQPRLCGRSKA